MVGRFLSIIRLYSCAARLVSSRHAGELGVFCIQHTVVYSPPAAGSDRNQLIFAGPQSHLFGVPDQAVPFRGRMSSVEMVLFRTSLDTAAGHNRLCIAQIRTGHIKRYRIKRSQHSTSGIIGTSFSAWQSQKGETSQIKLM